jgi:pimeloyl-[acyl-carrier protein] methyl ester esterase
LSATYREQTSSVPLSGSLTLVLLPGFDGTGELFGHFERELGLQWPVRVVRYRDERTFDDYVDSVAKLLPEKNAVLVAESFSGPIALALLAKHPSRIHAAALCATFAITPFRPLTRVARFVPSVLFGVRAGRRSMLRRLCLNDSCDPQLMNEALATIDSVPPITIKRRLDVLAGIDMRSVCSRVDHPVLILQGTRDRLLGRRQQELRNLLPRATVRELEGPHLLLQSRPRASADAIKEFLCTVIKEAQR